MKVELSIKDDTELRSMIRDTIRGQIVSIVRDEASEIIKEEVNRKLVALSFSSHQMVKLAAQAFADANAINLVMPVLEKRADGICELHIREVANKAIQRHIEGTFQVEIAKAVAKKLEASSIQLSLGDIDHD